MTSQRVPISKEEQDALWNDLEVVSTTLLRGEIPELNLVQRINKIRKENNPDEESLPEVLPKEKGTIARFVACAAGINDFCGLRGAIGLPKSPHWIARYLAASRYDPITMGDSEARLTVGIDKDGLGTSASMARLLAHYPPELARDSVFLALAGLEAEAWNGHAFVEAFFCLAENIHRAGFTLVVYPSSLENNFRQAFGIQSTGNETNARDGWAAEAFLDLPGILNADPVLRISQWLESVKSDAIRVRADADGKVLINFFQQGKITKAQPSWVQIAEKKFTMAAQEFNPRLVFVALGLPDLLEPGSFKIPTEISG